MTDTPGNETTEKGVLNGNDTRKTISLKSEENFTPNLTEKTLTGYAWELSLSKGFSILSDNYQGPSPPHNMGVAGTRSG